jgi:hypothetical protein
MTDNENIPAEDLISLNWKEAAKRYGEDFGEHTQIALKKEWEECQQAPYFQLCLKNSVALNPILNRSQTVRKHVNNWHY